MTSFRLNRIAKRIERAGWIVNGTPEIVEVFHPAAPDCPAAVVDDSGVKGPDPDTVNRLRHLLRGRRRADT